MFETLLNILSPRANIFSRGEQMFVARRYYIWKAMSTESKLFKWLAKLQMMPF